MHKIKNKETNTLDVTVITNQTENELYSLSRWATLFESINMIADKAEERRMAFDRIELKPLKILEYVDASSDIIMRKLLEEKEKNKQTFAKERD